MPKAFSDCFHRACQFAGRGIAKDAPHETRNTMFITMISVNVEVTLNLSESGLSVKKLQQKVFILVALLTLILEFVLMAFNTECLKMYVRMCKDVISQQQHRLKNKVHCHRPTVCQFLPSGNAVTSSRCSTASLLHCFTAFLWPMTTNHMSSEQFKCRLTVTFRFVSFEGCFEVI